MGASNGAASVRPPPSTDDPIDQFRAAMVAAGLTPPDSVEADGELHRFASDGRRGDDSGYYLLHLDGLPAGIFGCWRAGIKQTWHAESGRTFTPDERRQHRERVESMRRQRQTAEAERHRHKAEWARNIWRDSTPAPADHPYLARKVVKSYGLRASGAELLVPLATDGEIVNLQRIGPDGEKKFLPGGRVKGCYFAIGKPDDLLCIVEGYATGSSVHEATGAAVAVAFSAANLSTVAKKLRAKFPAVRIVICGDHDKSGTGQSAALEAARAVGGLVAIPSTEGSDWNDTHRTEGLAAVRAGIEAAREPDTDPSGVTEASSKLPPCGADLEGKLTELRALLPELAKLKPLDYSARRASIAKKYGVSVTALDAEVSELREPEETAQGLIFTDTVPADEVVSGAQLLTDLRDIFKRYVILPDHAPEALAAWTVLTWAVDSFDLLAMLHVSSPQKRCGKSTLMGLLHELVRRALLATSATPAALFRLIEQHAPTLLLDEADAWMRENEELRGIINGGHTRMTARVLRVVGDDHDVASFSTFCPKVISGIGHVADTIEDRSITIGMQRKLPRDRIESMRGVTFGPIRARCARWAADHEAALRDADPAIPDGLDDRAADNWFPLLAIADEAGGDWPERVRKAAVALSGRREDQSAAVLLLADIQELLKSRSDDPVPSAVIVEHLCALEGRPWPEWRHGRPMSATGLARMLGKFEIHPRTVRTGTGAKATAKGYHRAQFEDAFRRYLPAPGAPTVTPSQPLEMPGNSAFSSRHNGRGEGDAVTDEFCEKPVKNEHCDGVTLEMGESL
jgi:putative DNA primase/helicase